MAITDEMLGLSLAIVLLYVVFFNHRLRWVRIVGCGLIIVVTGAMGLVGDNRTMFVVFLCNLAVCSLKLISETSVIISKKRNAKGWF